MVGSLTIQLLLLIAQACEANQISCYKIFLFSEPQILDLQEKETPRRAVMALTRLFQSMALQS